MTASLERGSKVFELLEVGATGRKTGRRKLNVFARGAISEMCGSQDTASEFVG
jgi:hypothetical protein